MAARRTRRREDLRGLAVTDFELVPPHRDHAQRSLYDGRLMFAYPVGSRLPHNLALALLVVWWTSACGSGSATRADGGAGAPGASGGSSGGGSSAGGSMGGGAGAGGTSGGG